MKRGIRLVNGCIQDDIQCNHYEASVLAEILNTVQNVLNRSPEKKKKKTPCNNLNKKAQKKLHFYVLYILTTPNTYCMPGLVLVYKKDYLIFKPFDVTFV